MLSGYREVEKPLLEVLLLFSKPSRSLRLSLNITMNAHRVVAKLYIYDVSDLRMSFST